MSQKQDIRPAALTSLRDIVCSELRIRSLIYLTERQGSVAQMAEHFGADKATVSYHVKKLEGAGAVEVAGVREKPRGPHENVYRAVERPLIDDEESARLKDPDRQAWIERIFAMMVADTTAALQSGTFAARSDHNIMRLPALVDQQGWSDLTALLAETLDRALDIQAESTERMVENPDGPSIPVRVMTMLFESPAPAK